MPGKLTEAEQAFKKHWSQGFKTQQTKNGGYDDFGEFSAHVACCYQEEVVRLHRLLQEHSIDPGEWLDPLSGI